MPTVVSEGGAANLVGRRGHACSKAICFRLLL
jgi:hypothetical protein